MLHLKRAESDQRFIQVDQYKHLVLGLATISAKIGASMYQALIRLSMFKDQMTIPTMMIFGM